MSLDLTIPNPISGVAQTVADQSGNSSGLALATNATILTGQDVVNEALPVTIAGSAVSSSQSTWNRILRLANAAGQFYDLGIDSGGNFFINSMNSTATNHVLSITPAGQMTLGNLTLGNLTLSNLTLSNLAVAPSGSVDLTVNSQGVVFKQG